MILGDKANKKCATKTSTKVTGRGRDTVVRYTNGQTVL